IPSENVPARLSAAPSKPTSASTSSIRRRETGLSSDHTQVVTRGAAGVKRARLEHGPYLAGRVGEVGKAPPADPRLAARWRDEPEQHPQGRRLARAIRTDEARDAAGPDLKADVVHGTD